MGRPLQQRIEARYSTPTYRAGSRYQVREELKRLARQIRKLNTSTGQFYGTDESRICVRRKDVLRLLKEAEQ